MTHFPLVSIILPTYNRAELLPMAINSVLAQTYSKWELIIWNDGSIDDTDKAIHLFNDKRVIVFHDENHGMSFALNHAIREAHGEFIAFLDDDDQWTEQKLSLQLSILINNLNVDLVFGNFINIDPATGEKGIGFEQSSDAIRELKKIKINDHTFVIRENFFKSLCIDNFIAFDTAIIRRDVLSRVGRFNEDLKNGMDFEYWWRLALIGGVFAYTSEIVLNRIKYLGSLSSPSILTCENHIKGLGLCSKEALSKGRKDLIPYLNIPYRNTWQNMIPLYGNIGDKKGMLNAFYQSLKYGFNLGSIRLLFQSIISPKSNK